MGMQANLADEGRGFFWRLLLRVPDPVVIFAAFYAVAFALTVVFGGVSFAVPGNEETALAIRSMATAENLRWIFDNALVRNWVAYAHGLVPIVVVVMMGVGLAEKSGFLQTLMRLLVRGVDGRGLSYVIVGVGIASSAASDAAYFIFVPLAATLYATIGRNPFVGIAAAFAGVSAGFGANLIPSTPNDVIIGFNTIAFAEQMGVPLVSRTGSALCGPTMDYFFMAGLFVLFTLVGGFVTNRFVAPRVERLPWRHPDDFDRRGGEVTPAERRAVRYGLAGFLAAIAVLVAFACGPLAPYVGENGVRRVPYMENVILFVSLAFGFAGLAYGVAVGKFRCSRDVISASASQVAGVSYLMILTFVSFNFLALFSYSNLGAFVTCMGARALIALDLGSSPCVLMLGFMAMVGCTNLFISSLSAKWMLLGPVFIPMFYQVSGALTPEVVAAAYRAAEPCTNIVTPVMTFAGVILMFCQQWNRDFTIGEQILMMLPYSVAFFVSAAVFFLVWFKLSLPFGF